VSETAGAENAFATSARNFEAFVLVAKGQRKVFGVSQAAIIELVTADFAAESIHAAQKRLAARETLLLPRF
jgi:hypothetical protein